MRVAVGGDLLLSRPQDFAIHGGVKEFFDEAEVVYLNLEGPIGPLDCPTRKTGPNLAQAEQVVEHLAALGAAVTLANNHILDHGATGIRQTFDKLDSAGLSHTGVSLDQRPKSQRYAIHGQMAIVNRCEKEWVQLDQGGGAWILDVIEMVETIREIRSKNLLPILLLHGGQELWPFPSPRRRREARFYAEMGASAIVYHHTHVVSVVEEWNGVPIAYGLGNFAFDRASQYPVNSIGLVAHLTQTGTGIDLQTHFSQFTVGIGVTTLPESESIRKAEELHVLNSILTDEATYRSSWREFAERRGQGLLRSLPLPGGPTKSTSAVSGRLIGGYLLNRQRNLDVLLNVVRCDAHREVLEQFLESARTAPVQDTAFN